MNSHTLRRQNLNLVRLPIPPLPRSFVVIIDNWRINETLCSFKKKEWLGYLDSNQGMAASKAAALPLGDSPTATAYSSLSKIWCGRRDLNSHTLRRQNLNLVRLPIPPLPRSFVVIIDNWRINETLCSFKRKSGWATWIRTREWRHQKPLPYRLAIAQQGTAYSSLS